VGAKWELNIIVIKKTIHLYDWSFLFCQLLNTCPAVVVSLTCTAAGASAAIAF
jgi:hypothetical protein